MTVVGGPDHGRRRRHRRVRFGGADARVALSRRPLVAGPRADAYRRRGRRDAAPDGAAASSLLRTRGGRASGAGPSRPRARRRAPGCRRGARATAARRARYAGSDEFAFLLLFVGNGPRSDATMQRSMALSSSSVAILVEDDLDRVALAGNMAARPVGLPAARARPARRRAPSRARPRRRSRRGRGLGR